MNRILSSLIVLMIATGLYAQPGARREMIQDRVESQRIAFITQKLQLTPDESAKFWPLYNEYKLKHVKLTKSVVMERIEQAIENGGPDNLTDAEAENVIAQQFNLEESQLQLKREYYEKFKTALPVRKIARLNAVEREFNRTVLEQLREKMRDR